ncbi:MAG: bacteriohemerythrin [Gammaproteobacteria bacterium]
MPFMPWSDDLVTGLPKIDEQHRWLVDQTNELHDAIFTGSPDRDEVGRLLNGLVEYTFNHFVLEEELFQRLGYEESADHLKEHNGFIREVSAMLELHEDGGDVTVAALEFLKQWLRHHIVVVDMAYVPFMKEKLGTA